jgi:D-cysteine desulfhydrase
MNLAKFDRRRYTQGKTPIEAMPRLSKALAGPNIFIKRDDLTGLASGGNKTRKLEFLVADAIAKGADTLITVGAVQSNHCRLTLAAAAKEGLKCRLVLEQRVPGSYDPRASGNNFLFKLLGVEEITVIDGGADLQAAMEDVAGQLEKQGRKGYIIPGGGSNALGSLGYVTCFEEMSGQLFDMGLKLDRIVCASGSAGTHAGMVTGATGCSVETPIIGVNVRRPRPEQENNVFELAKKVSQLVGTRDEVRRGDIVCRDEWVGPGYSLPTPEMIEAVQMTARHESILLDPVYTGKAMAGLIGMIRKGEFAANENVLFLHTGGSPALYAYQSVLDGNG